MGFFTKNVGFEDKVIRILLAVLFVLLGIKYSKWFFVLAVITFLTAVFKWCGVYALLKINTLNGNFSMAGKKEAPKRKVKNKSRK